jgi:hypothetical protein
LDTAAEQATAAGDEILTLRHDSATTANGQTFL